jgi:hypothetical protein
MLSLDYFPVHVNFSTPPLSAHLGELNLAIGVPEGRIVGFVFEFVGRVSVPAVLC